MITNSQCGTHGFFTACRVDGLGSERLIELQERQIQADSSKVTSFVCSMVNVRSQGNRFFSGFKREPGVLDNARYRTHRMFIFRETNPDRLQRG